MSGATRPGKHLRTKDRREADALAPDRTFGAGVDAVGLAPATG